MTKKKRARRRKGPKRHLRISVVIGFLVIVLGIVSAFKVPGMVTDSKLRSLGYSNTTIKKIHQDKLTDTILKNDYYSDYLAKCIDSSSLRTEYIQMYTWFDDSRELTDTDFLLYNRLLDLGYETDQVEDLFRNLKVWEITPLLVYDYQWDESQYIKDCEDNRAKNSESSFTLSGDYFSEYKNVTNQTDGDDPVLVNKRWSLDAGYAPSDLANITTEYAVDGMQLRKEAATAFVPMAVAALNSGNALFASTSYVSYKDQNASYKSIASQLGSAQADIYSERAGFSEHQTGLAVNISATYDDNSNITATDVYKWLQENCVKYGFILRYPQAKADITQMANEPTHLLYVGKDTAEKIQASHLTYDEYYMLYLDTWYDAVNLPSKAILESTGSVDTVRTEAQ